MQLRNKPLPGLSSVALQHRRQAVQQSSVVLVVEAELAIQGFVEDVLSEAGFDAVFLSSGEQALTLPIGERSKFGALVADVKLGGRLDGWAVAKRAREIRPGLPVVYMTGMAPDEWASKSVPGSTLLRKPFAPAQLVSALSHPLGRQARRAPGQIRR
jgi:DNA-binding response OmpR family regulator